MSVFRLTLQNSVNFRGGWTQMGSCPPNSLLRDTFGFFLTFCAYCQVPVRLGWKEVVGWVWRMVLFLLLLVWPKLKHFFPSKEKMPFFVLFEKLSRFILYLDRGCRGKLFWISLDRWYETGGSTKDILTYKVWILCSCNAVNCWTVRLQVKQNFVMTYFCTQDWLEDGLQFEISPVVGMHSWVFISISEGEVLNKLHLAWFSVAVALWGAVTGPDSSLCLWDLSSCCAVCRLGSVSSCFHSIPLFLRLELFDPSFLPKLRRTLGFFTCTDCLHGLILDNSDSQIF